MTPPLGLGPAGERGAVGGAEVLPLALLVFVSGSLLLVQAWAVLDAKLAVSHAAREAGRAAVEVPDEAAARRLAEQAGRAASAGSGRPPTAVVLELRAEQWRRCADIEVVARARVPSVRLPFLGSFGPPITVHATHREVLDPYRSGLPGSADCG